MEIEFFDYEADARKNTGVRYAEMYNDAIKDRLNGLTREEPGRYLCKKVVFETDCYYLITGNCAKIRVNIGRDTDGSEYVSGTLENEHELKGVERVDLLRHPSFYVINIWD